MKMVARAFVECMDKCPEKEREAIKYLIGVGDLLTGKLLTFDALKMEFHTIKLPKADHKCAICGDHPTITELIDYEQIECPDH